MRSRPRKGGPGSPRRASPRHRASKSETTGHSRPAWARMGGSPCTRPWGRGSGSRSAWSIPAPAGRSAGPARHAPGWFIRSLALGPDGRSFATGSNIPPPGTAGEVRLWDTATGRPLLPPMPHTNWVSGLAFRPDGKVLAAGDCARVVRFWDTATGLEWASPLPHNEIVMSLAYSPDGKLLAVGLSDDYHHEPGTRLYDAKTTGPSAACFPTPAGCHASNSGPIPGPSSRGPGPGRGSGTRSAGSHRGAARRRAGRRASGPTDRRSSPWAWTGRSSSHSGTTGEVLGRLLTLPAPGTCAAFRGDGGLIAVGCEDGTGPALRPGHRAGGRPARAMRHAVHRVLFTADGRSVVAIDDFGETRTWPVPEPLADAGPDELTLRIEARTGLRMETGLSISRLDAPAWRDRLERLGRLDATAARLDDDPSWHEPTAREAEQAGNAFAATWHLDRLIAARPDNWLLYARRARARSASGRYDEAAADYRQAERVGPREDVLDSRPTARSSAPGPGGGPSALVPRSPDRRPARRVDAPRGPRGGLRPPRPRGRPAGRALAGDRAGGRQVAAPCRGPKNWPAPAAGTRPRPARPLWPRKPVRRRPDPGPGHRLSEGGRPGGIPRGPLGDRRALGTHPTPVLFIASTAQAMALGIGDPDEDRAIMARLEKWLQAVAAPPRTNATRPRTSDTRPQGGSAPCSSGRAASTRRLPD